MITHKVDKYHQSEPSFMSAIAFLSDAAIWLCIVDCSQQWPAEPPVGRIGMGRGSVQLQIMEKSQQNTPIKHMSWCAPLLWIALCRRGTRSQTAAVRLRHHLATVAPAC